MGSCVTSISIPLPSAQPNGNSQLIMGLEGGNRQSYFALNDGQSTVDVLLRDTVNNSNL